MSHSSVSRLKPFPLVDVEICLRVLAWVFFAPSAWDHYVWRIDPTISPAFALVELKASHWKHPELRLLLRSVYFVGPFIVSLAVGLARCLAGDSAEQIAFKVSASLAGGISAGVIFGMTIGVAGSIVVALAAAVACGLNDGIQWRVALCFAASLTAGVLSSFSGRSSHRSPWLHLGATALGILVSGLTILIGGVLMLLLRFLLPFDLAYGLAFGFLAGVILGARAAKFKRWTFSISVGILLCEAVGGYYGVAFTWVRVNRVIPNPGAGVFCGLAGGIANALMFATLFIPPFILARRIGGPWSAAVAGAMGSGGGYLIYSMILGSFPVWPGWLLAVLSLGLGLTVLWWRPLLSYPFEATWNLLLFRADERRLADGHPWFMWHAALWDEYQFVPFAGLSEHLVLVLDRNHIRASWDLDKVSRDRLAIEPHRGALLLAETVILARKAARVHELTDVHSIFSRMPEGEKGFLRETRRLREMVENVTGYQVRLSEAGLPIVREVYAQMLLDAVCSFSSQVQGFREPLAREFGAAAKEWSRLAEKQLQTARAALRPDLIPQVFVAGDFVDRKRGAFVPRYSVIDPLYRELSSLAGCPGVILYGRRRTGKTTVLQNLVGFLPKNVRHIVVPMLDPQVNNSLESFITYIVERVNRAYPNVPSIKIHRKDLPGLMGFLEQVNNALEAQEARLLLALDEYTYIDHNIGHGVFPENVLSMFRESVQSHRRVTWIFSGSHEFEEMSSASWTDYLISTLTIEVPMFTECETRGLLTDPFRHASLWPEENRPRFPPECWGERGIERIHAEAGGWPHFVQLIAKTVLTRINAQQGRPIDEALMEQALEEAVSLGHAAIENLMKRECRDVGEWNYLAGFGRESLQPPPHDDTIARSLRRRLLISEEEGLWALRVPLMGRWLLKNR
jgi:hypothetical protein